MLVPSPTMCKAVIVRDTMADNFLQTQTLMPHPYDGVRRRDSGYDSFGAYYSLFLETQANHGVTLLEKTMIEGGWQRLSYLFPDRSVAVVYKDYGYSPRPNKFGGMVIPTSLELLRTLDIPA